MNAVHTRNRLRRPPPRRRRGTTATPNPAALSAVGATFEKEVDADED